MTDKILEVRGLTKTYGGVKKKGAKQPTPTLDVLKGIDIDIYRGDVVCLIGPSGCGKSTFLRCLNRLEIPTSGSIKFEGVEVDDAHIDAVRQKMGMVFQHFNLFPHLTVKKNLELAPTLLKLKDKQAISDVLGSEYYQVLNGYVPHGAAGINGEFRDEADADGYTLTYDPETAKQLLAEAGYDESNPLKTVYKYSNHSIHGDVATMLQSFWAAVGVDVSFDSVESSVYYDQEAFDLEEEHLCPECGRELFPNALDEEE